MHLSSAIIIKLAKMYNQSLYDSLSRQKIDPLNV